MAQLNRDKETLYAPGRLSRWFLVSSGVLTVALVAMVWQDYDRPWKKTQADFYRRQAKLLAAAREVEDAELFETPTKESQDLAARKKELEGRRAAAKARLAKEPAAGEIARLEQAVREQDVLLEEADRNIKSQKGKYSEAKWQLEWARTTSSDAARDPAVARLLARVDDIADEQSKWEQRRRPVEVRRTELLDRLADLRKDVTSVEKQLEDIEKSVADVEKRRGATEAKTEKDVWRNLPVLDIVAPSISIDKAVTPNIHDDYNFATLPKIDVCMTCHRGIGDSTMDLAAVRDLLAKYVRVKVGERAWDKIRPAIGTQEERVVPVVRNDRLAEDPAKAPPPRTSYEFTEWTPAWTEAAFRAWTERPDATLLYDPDRGEAPPKGLLPKRLVEDSLAPDQVAALTKPDVVEPFRAKAVEWGHPHMDLMVGSTSKHPVSTTGCTVCHQGRGRATDFTRAAHTPATREQHERWTHDYRWAEAEMWDWPMLPLPYAEGQCLKCHLPGVEWTPRTERLGLRDLVDPLAEMKAPKAVDDARARLRRAAYDGVVLRGFDQLLDRSNLSGQWSKAAAHPEYAPQMTALARDGERAAEGAWEPDRLARGVTMFRDWGCVGCHYVKGIATSPGWNATAPRTPGDEGDLSTPEPGSLVWADSGPRKVGPDLRHAGDKMSEAFVVRWIDDPTSFRIDTRMPAFFHVREHDDDYQPTIVSGRPVDRTVVVDPTARDRAQTNVEPLALAKYILAASTPLPGGYPDVPAGDAQKGSETFYSVGCFACHVGPGRYDAQGARIPDDGARFRLRGDLDPTDPKHERRRLPELPPGPRLVGLGSKVNAKWLFEWLREPRHYWSATNMPNMRWRAELGPDGTTVVRTAEQVRADVVAYLLSSRDAEFEQRTAPGEGDRWTQESENLLDDMWLEWYGKGQYYGPAPAPPTDKDPAAGRVFAVGKSDAEARKAVRERPTERKLIEVGYRLVGQRGCFGCHNVGGYEYRGPDGKVLYAFAGYEKEQPIGKELSAEGSQDLHKFDFGLLLASHEVEDTRWGWIDTKLREPRIYDKGRFLPRWTDKLRMPKFNFRSEDREAVVTTVLGMVKEPIQPSALYAPDARMQRVARGRAVVARYHCNQCHTIEGLRGIAVAAQLLENKEQWMLPPNLYSEGNRVQSGWVFRFLKNPDSIPDGSIRPSVIQRMPKFRLSDAEAAALVDYFLALAERTDRMWTDPHDRPLDETPFAEPLTIAIKDASGKNERHVTARSPVEEAKALFDTFNCVKCHLKKGTPGADPNDGGTAPPFALAKDRLRTDWIYDMLHDPQSQIENTKMVAFWPLKAKRVRKPDNARKVEYPQFTFDLRGKEKVDADPLAEAQMDALARYLRFHFHDAAPPPTEPVPK